MDWFSAWDPGPYIEIEAGRRGCGSRTTHCVAYRDRGRAHLGRSLVPSARFASLVLLRDRRARRRGALPVRARAVLLGIRGSHGDCVCPALPRSQLSRAVAASAAGGDAAGGAARLARESLRLIFVN